MRADKIIHSPKPFLDNQYMVLLETESVSIPRQFSTQYSVYIGDNTKRIFQAKTLPIFIKTKLAMIKSIPKEEWNAFNDEIFMEIDCYIMSKFTRKNPEFKHIGWCVSDSIYVIIMSEEELSELKGIRIDTREKSQSKSKTNS